MSFIDNNFMLTNELAQELYNKYSKNMPIYDYHCHLSAQEIYDNHPFDNLYDVWLKGDHYKWRLMRFYGINEQYIANEDNQYESYARYVKTLECAIGNPLYHWSHLELLRCFGIDDIIKENNTKVIWDKANAYIKNHEYSPRSAIEQFNVDTIVTTEEVYSDLAYHKKLDNDTSFKPKVLPSFRGDKIVNMDLNAITKLSEVTSIKIGCLDNLLDSIVAQLDRFNGCGAILADMGLEGFEYRECNKETADLIFQSSLQGKTLSSIQEKQIATYMMLFLMRQYYSRDWAVLLHIGAKRNNNTQLYNKYGTDIGVDSISDKSYINGLNKLLDTLFNEQVLGKTIVYSLNPTDYYKLTTTIGNFASDRARMQLGISWWFADSKIGIETMMQEYASLSHLGSFVGMLTDSRSFLSYTRHEYFRRILCNYVAKAVENGEYPNDQELLSSLINGISYENTCKYFG